MIPISYNNMELIQTKITDFYYPLVINNKVYGYNEKTRSWHCLLCGIDMGINNPRQLCRKSYCDNPDTDYTD